MQYMNTTKRSTCCTEVPAGRQTEEEERSEDTGCTQLPAWNFVTGGRRKERADEPSGPHLVCRTNKQKKAQRLQFWDTTVRPHFGPRRYRHWCRERHYSPTSRWFWENEERWAWWDATAQPYFSQKREAEKRLHSCFSGHEQSCLRNQHTNSWSKN